ncbi:HET-domain-containing protein [Ophiobolus disseminans]|uniref:HET-domain-containing protein n=1 Tax=Ophiobolus disseminans TaxID=1469910 RepID=A0A6A7A7K4_9PLEO|nr:HET-domain-containing protein [Ophiobolus disseminans]
MNKLARLKQRWSDRRTDNTPSPNRSLLSPPSKIEEHHSEPSKRFRNPPQDPSNPTHDSQDSLCERCISLHVGSQLELEGRAATGLIATIEKTSLNSKCGFCTQLCDIFEEINSWSTHLVHSEIRLSRHALDILDERGGYFGHYLCIHFGEPIQEIRLYPSHGIFDNLSYNRKTAHPLGNALNPMLSDFEMARLWLHTCRLNHGMECKPSASETSILRLIDCRTRRIIQATRSQSYICLSYVWGTDVTLVSANQTILPDLLPKTVEDAMFVAINLSIPFLWVDRYCIDQDNLEEKHSIIRNMDRIYQGAELTIIASVGNDPHNGLPSVLGTPRKLQCRLQGNTYSHLAAEDVADEILQSKWNSRGWTVNLYLAIRPG